MCVKEEREGGEEKNVGSDNPGQWENGVEDDLASAVVWRTGIGHFSQTEINIEKK